MTNIHDSENSAHTPLGDGKQPSAWLCLAKPTDSFVAERDGYVDQIGAQYSWDNTVPNYSKPNCGDIIAIWDGEVMLGISWIEKIGERMDKKIRRRCPIPECRSTDVRRSKGSGLKYRCGKCRYEFDHPITEELAVTVYVAEFRAGWTPTPGIDAATCRTFAKQHKSQHSIRSADADALLKTINDLPAGHAVRFNRRNLSANGGLRKVTVFARIGQGKFREDVLAMFSSVCAFTGPNHEAALEAAHLYRYSEHAAHFSDGGLLMRRDIHRLFDLGLLAICPSSHTIDVHPEVASINEYGALHGQNLRVQLKPAHVRWLDLHWNQFRPLIPEKKALVIQA